MTTAWVSARCFKGNREHARIFLRSYRNVPRVLCKSRLIRLLHRICLLFLTVEDIKRMGDPKVSSAGWIR